MGSNTSKQQTEQEKRAVLRLYEKRQDEDMLQPMHKIKERLYLGSVAAAGDVDELKQAKITHIVNCLEPGWERYKAITTSSDSNTSTENDKENNNVTPSSPTSTEASSSDNTIENSTNNATSNNKVIFTCEYLSLDMDDISSYNARQHFISSINFIRQALNSNDKNVVLCHCVAGISRSATITIAYLMTEYHLSLQSALNHVQSIRTIVQPNPGFIKQLQAYEQELIKSGIKLK